MSTSYTIDSYLVTPHDLDLALRKNVYSRLSTAPRIIPLCASWFLPNDPKKRTGIQSFLESRIPKARFFDLDAVKDHESPYPHMLPSAEIFAKAMGELGIRRDDSVVIYDSSDLGIFSAPRVAWTLKVFGHDGVHILNNYKLWVDQGYPVEKGEEVTPYDKVDYPVPTLDKSKVISFEELKERISERNKEGAEEVQVLDARPARRFEGKDPEPREGLSSGHIPNSISIPFSDVISARTKALLPGPELKLYFETKNIDPNKPIIASCGTGVTAAVLDAALTEAGYPEEGRKIYDGSWTEWAQRVKPEEELIVKKK
ncbi:Rhodanese-like protein [Tothia fuscella]|uniref:Rhodanese-like protein n=1 Tax=Tothia fuscella TaxID=1048955 RepID=A0A9P4P576_9PEZI|nr:Rhodanese-like protein [Tothia fuscella]